MKYKWGDLISLEYGKPVADKDSIDGPVPVFGTNGQIGTSHLPPLCKESSFILGRKGAYRGVKYSDIPFSVIDTAFYAMNQRPDILLIKWAYYKFLTYDINSMDSGSAIPSTDRYEIYGIEVDLPDYDTQKRVVSILDSLDDKIELNNRINENLEQQAQSVFESWFIDYTPIGGYVPSDWISTTLGSVCRCELGGTPSRAKPEYWNGDIPWINSGEVNKFRIIQPSEEITELGLSKSATKLLPKKTTVIAITGATLGQVSLLEIDACANQSVVGVVPNSQLPYEFIYPFIKANIKELISHQTGGAQQHINKQNVESLPVVVPSENVLNRYVSSVTTLYEMIANNCFENERLVEMRDALLPKLMSGELDVSEIDL